MKLPFLQKHLFLPAIILSIVSSCTSGDSFRLNVKPSEAVNGGAAQVMVDLDRINDPAKEWCYTPKTTTAIGMPFMPRPVQVTYDGALYTRDAEVCFFYGDSLKPLMARQKTFLEGWIPVVQYDWQENGISYAIEMFGAEMSQVNPANTLLFVRLTAGNISDTPREAILAAASRFSGEDHRLGSPLQPCLPGTRFEMQEAGFLRDGKLIYTFPVSSEMYAVNGVPYSSPFQASDLDISGYTATGISRNARLLKPGETFHVDFKMPNFPVALSSEDEINFIAQAGYDEYRQKTIGYWRDKIEGGSVFSIPEKRVNDSYKAGLVHLMLATRDQNGRRQGSGLPYDDLFLNDYIDMLLAYETAGLHEFSEPNVDWLISKQHESGMFIDVHNRGNSDFVTSHGQGLFTLAYPAVFNQDSVFARQVYPYIRKGADFIVNDHLTNNEYGLIRPSIPYDAPMITGYHTCHNLFALLALRTSIRVARMLQETGDYNRWIAAEATYREAILKAIAVTIEKEGYIHPALYEWEAGLVQGNPALGPNTFPAQDWENNLLIYPTELMQADDDRIKATLDTIRKRKYREGIMTYRNGMHLHQYATVNQAHQYMGINDQESALKDLYHILLHNGSTHEGFEDMIEPWEDMDPWPIPAPHAWAAAKTALLIRNMLVREYGGEGGLNENGRSLYLFSVISPEWALSGQPVVIKNAITEMGKLSAEMSFSNNGASITIDPSFHTSPATIAIAIPWYVKLKDFTSNAASSEERNGYLVFSPDVTDIKISWQINRKAFRNAMQNLLISYREENSIRWRDLSHAEIIPGGEGFLLPGEVKHPAEHLSFDLVKRAFITEYNRRFREYLAEGKVPMTILPPPMNRAAVK
jgi:hypothetical protein